MQWFMQWRVQAIFGLIGFGISALLAGDNQEKLPSISVAIIAAAFWTSATRLYLSEKR